MFYPPGFSLLAFELEGYCNPKTLWGCCRKGTSHTHNFSILKILKKIFTPMFKFYS